MIDIEKRNIFVILKKDIQSVEILEAYFYASMCAFYLCIARKIPIVRNPSFFYIFCYLCIFYYNYTMISHRICY